jgi:protein-S-isoprenylcysteine O-methyltransferase Ste14
MHLARKIRRQTGHSAKVLPPDRIGKITRIIWFPTIFFWIALPLAGPFLKNRFAILRPLFASATLAWITLFASLLAFIATLFCWKKMGKSWRMGIDPAEKTALIVTGPYLYVRHPIYALSSLLMLCTGLVYPSTAMIAVGLVHLCLLQLEARREEAYMANVHGAVYVEYCGRTGRFLPRF